MPTSDFLPFATNVAANVVSQADWVTDPAVSGGFTTGVADSDRCNKVWRQSSFIAAGIAQFVMQENAQDVHDDGDLPGFVADFIQALGTATGSGGFVPEAPNTGILYGRRSLTWVGPVIDQTALNSALLGYVKRVGDSMTGNLDMTNNHINAVRLDSGSIAAPTSTDVILQIRRASTVGVVPASNSLQAGELAVQMGETAAPRLWVGVPTSVDATGRRLLADLAASAAFLPLVGGTLTGPLTIQASGDPPMLVFRNSLVSNTAGGLWGIDVGSAGALHLRQNTASGGDFSSFLGAITIEPTTSNVTVRGTLMVSANPNPTLGILTSGYTSLLAPDNAVAAGGGIHIGSTAAGTTFYRQANHSFQNRDSSLTYGTWNSSGLTVNNSIQTSGPIMTIGSTGSLAFQDRGNSANIYLWYCTGNIARLFNGTDKLTIDISGNLVSVGNITAQGNVIRVTSGTSPSFILSNTTAPALNVAVRNSASQFQFALLDGSLNYVSTLGWFDTAGKLTLAAGLAVSGNPTAVVDATSNYTRILAPDNAPSIFVGAVSGGASTNFYRNAVHTFQSRDAAVTFGTFNSSGLTTPGLNVTGTTNLAFTHIYVAGGDIPLVVQADVGHYAMIKFIGGKTWNAGSDPTLGGNYAIGEETTGLGWFSIEPQFQLGGRFNFDIQVARFGIKPGGGVWSDVSDQRVKKNIERYERGLEAVRKLRPVTFRFNGLIRDHPDDRTFHGLVAQEVQDIMPEMVFEHSVALDETGSKKGSFLAMDATALSFALVNSVQELAARIDKLEGKDEHGAATDIETAPG